MHMYIFLLLSKYICYGYSKEPSQWEDPFEHQKYMLKLMGKKIVTSLLLICIAKYYDTHFSYGLAIESGLMSLKIDYLL